MRRRQHGNPLSLFSFQDIITSVTGILILLAIMLAIAVIRQKDAAPVVDASAELDTLSEQAKTLEAEVAQLGAIVTETDAQLAKWSGRTLEELQTEHASLLASRSHEESKLKQKDQTVSDARQRLQLVAADPQIAKLKKAIAEAERQLSELKKKQDELTSGKRVVYHFRNTTSRPWLVEIAKDRIRVGRAGEKAKPQDFTTYGQFVSFVQGQPDDDRYFVLILKPSGIDNHEQIRAELESLDVEIGTELIGEDQTVLDSQSGADFQ